MRPGTAVVVAAVAAVAVAALVASLADGSEPAPPAAVTTPAPVTTSVRAATQPAPAGLADRLARAGVTGVLTYSDASAGCRLVALRLPSLARVRAPADRVCDFDLAPDGRVVAPSGAVWRPDGRAAARCRGDKVELLQRGVEVGAVGGCTPAWQPDGTLTVVRPEGVIAYRIPCRILSERCTRLLLPRSVLLDAARRHVDVPGHDAAWVGRVIVQDLVWTAAERAVALLDVRLRGRLSALGLQQVVASFVDGRVAWVRTRLRSSLEGLAASPGGDLVAAPPDLVLRPDGTTVPVPAGLRDVRAVAWSPDERFVAYATRASIYLYEGARFVARLPTGAADLAWR